MRRKQGKLRIKLNWKRICEMRMRRKGFYKLIELSQDKKIEF